MQAIYTSAMEIDLEFKDEASPFLEMLVKNNPKWQIDALKSAAWLTSRVIKREMKTKAPGGKQWAPMSLTGKKRRALEIITGGKVASRYTLYGRLVQAIGYEGRLAAIEGAVPVGWLSWQSQQLGEKLQEGFTTDVTPKVRKLYAAAGLKISKHKVALVTPARPVLDPMKNKLAYVATKQFEKKILSYMMGNTTRSKASSKARYVVYQ